MRRAFRGSFAVMAAMLLGAGCSDSRATNSDDSRISSGDAKADKAIVDAASRENAPPRPDSANRDSGQPDQTRRDQMGLDIAKSTFPAILEGIWLVGWSGGMHHYSWVRFTLKNKDSGDAYLLAGKDLTSNLPYWNCSGTSAWTITARPDTIQINFHESGCMGERSASYTFSNFKVPPAGLPRGATLQADVEGRPTGGSSIMAYTFPDAQCNASMTTCKDPLK